MSTKRVYEFPLPYTISSIQVEFGIGQLKNDGIFQGLPPDLQQRLQDAANHWQSAEVTEADLNSIPDGVWKNLASRLGLKYQIVADGGPAKKIIGTTSAGISF